MNKALSGQLHFIPYNNDNRDVHNIIHNNPTLSIGPLGPASNFVLLTILLG